MNAAFLIGAATLCVWALAPILWPLIRPVTGGSAPARTLAAVLALALPLGALALYQQFGNPRALDPKQRVSLEAELRSAPDLATAVSRLEQRLADGPPDADGLRLLAQGYQQLQQFADARDTLAKAHGLRPDDVDITVEYAEALALAAPERSFDGEPTQLLADVLTAQPTHQRALWLSGIAALQRDDRTTALSHWQTLLPLLPPDSSVRASVAEQIEKLGGTVAASAPAFALTVTVTLADALADRVQPTDTVFVFARAAEGPKMPLAIQRFPASQLPTTITLDDSMGMVPTLELSQQARIVVGARVSRSGNAMAQPGDLEALSEPLERAAIDGPITLDIARIVP